MKNYLKYLKDWLNFIINFKDGEYKIENKVKCSEFIVDLIQIHNDAILNVIENASCALLAQQNLRSLFRSIELT